MALSSPSLLVWGFEVTQNNRYLDFLNVSMGTQITATLNIGSYSLTQYALEVARAMNVADSANTYAATVDRSNAGGLQNRVTITSSGTFLTLLFGSGTHAAASPASMLGFNASNYTGAVTYTGATTAGESLVSVYPGYTFVAKEESQMVAGSVNVSADGSKEAIVWAIQVFPEIEFQHEPAAKVRSSWLSFFQWAIQQQAFELTPEYPTYGTYYQVSLESTEESGQGLAFKMKEMLPGLPGLYRTGRLKFRLITQASEFI